MLIDKLTIWIPGHITHPRGVDQAVKTYRDALANRSETRLGRWTSPTRQAHKFTTRLGGQVDSKLATLSATLIAENRQDRAALTLTLRLNPTRTLVHTLAHAADEAGSSSPNTLPPDAFFAVHPNPRHAPTTNGDDNAVRSYSEAARVWGEPVSEEFLLAYEGQLERWTIDAVAPLEVGFVHNDDAVQRVAQLGGLGLTLAWDKMVVKYAEAYCERRHGTAREVIERLSAHMTSASTQSSWNSYPVHEMGGRSGKVMSVGFQHPKTVRHVYYAKTADRVRIETRYEKRVMNGLGYPDLGSVNPLCSRLAAIRADATRRNAYLTFCSMIAERNTITVHDMANLIATVASCAVKAKVAVEPVVASLIATGGIDQTRADGIAPERLIDRLIDAKLIERLDLGRNAPGAPIRFTLVGAYHEAARRVQEAFQDQTESEG